MGQIDLESDLPYKCSFISIEAVATCFARGYPDSDTRHCTSFSVSICRENQIKSLTHLFLHSDIARYMEMLRRNIPHLLPICSYTRMLLAT